jgi:ADP-heptose:LPS heptosyltransferase
VKTVLVARLDSDGDVLLAGPAVRAVAAGADRVVLLCGPRGRAAAELLPGVDDVVVWHCPWIDAEPSPVDRPSVERLVDRVRARGVDEALVLTSYHQDPLPLALLLRLAGVGRIAAICEDYPGSLLDVRHRLPETGLHEVERMLSLAAAAGFWPPAGDDGMLAVRSPLPDTRALTGNDPYVVMHPGASVPARAPSPQRAAAVVDALVTGDRRVLVTGSPGERPLTAQVAGAPRAGRVCDLGGRTDLARLADVLSRADAVVVGNTGPAHLAAAVGTPVVSLFAPTVPAERWRPWRVPHVLLGDGSAACAGSRARSCPVPGHPCLDGVPVGDVVAAVDAVAGSRLVEVGR